MLKNPETSRQYLLDQVIEKARRLERSLNAHGLKETPINSDFGKAWLRYAKVLAAAVVDADIGLLEKILGGMEECIKAIPRLAEEEEEHADWCSSLKGDSNVKKP